MSLALDGRLPSRRRTVLFAHRDACAPCTRVWNEMRTAQDLVLGLPPTPVSASFRVDLWERIRSGEGAPETLLHEPIPFAAKVRYVAAGAAAAAGMLLVLHLARGDDSTVEPGPKPPQRVTEVAKATGDPRPSPADDLEIVPITPQLAAETCVNTCATVTSQLQRELPELDQRPFAALRRELLPTTFRAREAAGLMLWLDGEGFVQLNEEAARDYAVLEQLASHAEQATNPAEFRLALEPVRDLQAHRMKKLLVRCCDVEPKFQLEFGQQMASGAPWDRLFDLVVPGVPPVPGFEVTRQLRLQGPDNQPRMYVLIRTQTLRGSNPVNGGRR